MKCPKCKKQLRKNARFCPACGARIKRKQRMPKLLISAILLVIVALGWVLGIWVAKLFGSNNRALFSGMDTVIIHNAEDAIAHVKEYGEEYGYENALSELTEQVTTTIGGDNYYRLQQNYQGIPVYGRTVVCTTDENGMLASISGNAMDVTEGISMIPSVTLDTIELSIAEYCEANLGISLSTNFGFAVLTDDSLCIYISSTEKSSLAYCVSCGGYEFVVDAVTGKVLASRKTFFQDTVTCYNFDHTVNIPDALRNTRYEKEYQIENPESFDLNLPGGLYTLTVSDKYSSAEYSVTVYVSNEGTDDSIEIFTSYEVPLVVVIPDEELEEVEPTIEETLPFAQSDKQLTSVIRYSENEKTEYYFNYNEQGLITEVIGTSPNGGEELICLQKMIYDSNSRIIELWYPWVEWLSWPKDSYQYSPEGYLLSETHSEGGTSEEVYTLDVNGRAMLKTVTFDTGSEIHTYTYDASGRLSQDIVVRSYIDGTTFTDSFSYEYDVQGRLAMAHGSVHGSSASTSYCYDFKPFTEYTYSATGTANSTTLQIQDCVGHKVWSLYNLYDPHYTVDEAGYVTQITESGYDGKGSTIYLLYNGDTLNEKSIVRNTESVTSQTMDLITGENSSSDMAKSIGNAILGTWMNDMDFEYVFFSDGTYTLSNLVILGKDTLLQRITIETGFYEIYNHDTARLYLDGQSYVWTEAVYDFYSGVLIVGGDIYEKTEYMEVTG